jgi:hypothetical protein
LKLAEQGDMDELFGLFGFFPLRDHFFGGDDSKSKGKRDGKKSKGEDCSPLHSLLHLCSD